LKRAWKIEFADEQSKKHFYEVWNKSDEDIWDYLGDHMADNYAINSGVSWYWADTLEELREQLEENYEDFLDEEEGEAEEAQVTEEQTKSVEEQARAIMIKFLDLLKQQQPSEEITENIREVEAAIASGTCFQLYQQYEAGRKAAEEAKKAEQAMN
jgi:tRNA U34 5-carboxymethylaminomethyl modifying GTPase MnmE/TrmE